MGAGKENDLGQRGESQGKGGQFSVFETIYCYRACRKDCMWNLKLKREKRLRYRERMVVARDKGWRVGKMGAGNQKVQSSSYKVSKSRECHAPHGDYS